MVRTSPLAATVLMILLAGCQVGPSVELPPPNFNAPPVVAQAPVPMSPERAPTPAIADRVARVPGPREWNPAVKARAWRWIVIHHSATPTGSVNAFDRIHRDKGWDECGYHFVIGNGRGSGDGQIEVGPRWPKQKWGAHAKTPDNRFNEYGIGICLVGNFDLSRPTPQQQQSLARLVAYLMRTYNIPPDRVIGHRDTKATECPGRYVNIAAIRQSATRVLADAGLPIPSATVASTAVELTTSR